MELKIPLKSAEKLLKEEGAEEVDYKAKYALSEALEEVALIISAKSIKQAKDEDLKTIKKEFVEDSFQELFDM